MELSAHDVQHDPGLTENEDPVALLVQLSNQSCHKDGLARDMCTCTFVFLFREE